MPFCPRCRCEYNVGVAECIDCHVPLVLHRPKRRSMLDVDWDELLVPVGGFVCLTAAVGLLWIRVAAGNGQIAEPLASAIVSQPTCMTVFYVIAAILSALVVAASVIRWVFFR